MERLTKRIDGVVVFPAALAGVVMVPDNKAMQDVLSRLAAYEDTGLTPEEVWEALESISAAPVVHGQWEPCSEERILRQQLEGDKCSVCGFEYYGTNVRNYNYCPKCGAKMDGGDGDAAD